MAKDSDTILGLIVNREIIFEHQSNPTSTQTHAIDVDSGIEAVVTSPRHTRRQDQELLALKKLARTLMSAGILAVADGKIDNEGAQAQSGTKARPTRGIIA